MTKTTTNNQKVPVLIRSEQAGVFYGTLEGDPVTTGGVPHVVMAEARRIWYWSGACSLSQIAQEGVKNPQACKFSVRTHGHYVFGVCEILPITPEALKSLDSVVDWKA